MRSTSITSDLDRMVGRAIQKIYRSFTWIVTRQREPLVPDVNSVPPTYIDDTRQLTVEEFIDILKGFPEGSVIGFQLGDNIDSPTLQPTVIEHDSMWNVTDIVFEEWKE